MNWTLIAVAVAIGLSATVVVTTNSLNAHDGDPSRFQMVASPVGNYVVRMDTVTGAASACSLYAGKFTCSEWGK